MDDCKRFGLGSVYSPFALAFLYGCINGEPEGVLFVDIILDTIFAAVAICFKMQGKHQCAERVFVDELKAQCIEAEIE